MSAYDEAAPLVERVCYFVRNPTDEAIDPTSLLRDIAWALDNAHALHRGSILFSLGDGLEQIQHQVARAGAIALLDQGFETAALLTVAAQSIKTAIDKAHHEDCIDVPFNGPIGTSLPDAIRGLPDAVVSEIEQWREEFPSQPTDVENSARWIIDRLLAFIAAPSAEPK